MELSRRTACQGSHPYSYNAIESEATRKDAVIWELGDSTMSRGDIELPIRPVLGEAAMAGEGELAHNTIMASRVLKRKSQEGIDRPVGDRLLQSDDIVRRRRVDDRRHVALVDQGGGQAVQHAIDAAVQAGTTK